jgi:hypothetical protein
MKSYKILFVVAALISASFAFAADAAKDAAPKKANCCVKAEKDGKACDHKCCVAAAKEHKNCETCKGTNAPAAAKH